LARTPKIPRQPRGERRVADLLDAAEAVLTEKGFEAATMSAVAERAHASIGSLYQFFPNKMAITQALRSRYAHDYEELCAPLEAMAGSLNLHDLVDHLMRLNVAFVENHPAFVALLDAPNSSHIPAALRARLRLRFARIFRRRKPRLSRQKSEEMAVVTLHLLKAMNQIYAATAAVKRRRVAVEFKAVLTGYLGSRLGLES
jgi:AcrR family transcriptional regulator